MSKSPEQIIDNPSLVRERWLSPQWAEREVVEFEREFGQKHLRFACHAALPLIVTPELLNLIRINFLSNERIPWVAEIDLPLFSLCRPIDQGIYTLEPGVREILFVKLENLYGQEYAEQIKLEIARFLLVYWAQKQDVILNSEIKQYQEWIARAYLDLNGVLSELQDTLHNSLSKEESSLTLAKQIQVIKALELLADPLEKSNLQEEYQDLISSSRILAYTFYGKEKISSEQINRKAREAETQGNLLLSIVLKQLGTSDAIDKEPQITDEEIKEESSKLPDSKQKTHLPIMQKKILILTASPGDRIKLSVDKEITAIKQQLERSKNRDKFQIIAKLAVKPDNLIRVLQEEEPEIVHFCGHGTKTGLVFENESGEAQTVKAEALAKLFERFKDKVECVLLNACYTYTQAEAINKHIQYVIGMTEQIEDTAAIKFAVNFYATLIAGRSYEDAYEFGRIALDLLGIQDDLLPVFLKSQSTTLIEKKYHNLPTPFHYSNMINAFKNGRVIPFLGSGINLYERQPSNHIISDIEIAHYLTKELGMENFYKDLVGSACPFCLGGVEDLPEDCPIKKAWLEGRIAACPLANEQALAVAKLNLQYLADYKKLTSNIQDVYQRIHDFFESSYIRPNKLHEFFANLPREMADKGYPLPYKVLVTTNYDDMLERAFMQAKQRFDVLFYVPEGENRGRFLYKPHGQNIRSITSDQQVLSPDRPVILKLYGTLNNFVITEDHHINYLVKYKIDQLLPHDLLEILWGENNHILFMGVSPNDRNLRLIVNRLWGERVIGQQSWMIHQSKPGELEKEFWTTRRKVKLLDSDLEEYLNQLNQKIEELTSKKSHPYFKWETIR